MLQALQPQEEVLGRTVGGGLGQNREPPSPPPVLAGRGPALVSHAQAHTPHVIHLTSMGYSRGELTRERRHDRARARGAGAA